MSNSTATGDPPASGLPADRTALLTIKNLHGSEWPARLIPAFLAAAVALGTYVIALHRQRTLQQPIPIRITPCRPVYIVGIAAMVLIAVTTVAQLL